MRVRRDWLMAEGDEGEGVRRTGGNEGQRLAVAFHHHRTYFEFLGPAKFLIFLDARLRKFHHTVRFNVVLTKYNLVLAKLV